MVNVVERHSHVRTHDGHEVYFDNFFTSHKLLKDLGDKSVRATGTVGENRTGGAAKLMTSTKEMKKKERGHFDFRCDGDVYICKWNDNSIVHVASNHQSHESICEAKRRVKGAQTATVKQPYLIHEYKTDRPPLSNSPTSSMSTTQAWVVLT